MSNTPTFFHAPGDAGLDGSARRLIPARSRSIDELLRDARAAGVALEGEPDRAALSAVDAWNQAFSPKDPESFARRLSWDGLTRASAGVLLSTSTTDACPHEPATWLAWLDHVVASAEEVAGEFAGTGQLPEAWAVSADEELPFVELLVPMVRTARVQIDRRCGSLAERIAPAARHAFERQLARELAGVTALALRDRLTSWLSEFSGDDAEAEEETRPDPYRVFAVSMLDHGLASCLAYYPVLARQVAIVLEGHVAAVSDLIERLAEDAPAIGEVFAGGRDPGQVVAVAPALSDPHEGRRRVVVLTFGTGLRLVYKPRDLKLDAAFSALLDWVAAKGLAGVPSGLRVLPRPGYGWVEFAVHGGFATPNAVRQYYRRAGSLLCLAHVLRARDLHMENVVATSEGPVLIDLEMLFEPVAAGAAEADSDAESGGASRDTCLSTGLITFVEGGPDSPLFEVGGYRGTGTGAATLARRRWQAVGTTAIHLTEESQFSVETANAVLFEGTRQLPEDFPDAVIGGFRTTYETLLAHRDELLSPGGPLSAFAGCETRVISRPTNQYAMLLQVLAAPKYQQRGTRRSAGYDVLTRAFASTSSRPTVWPLLVAERAALDRLDIPRFVVRTDDVRVVARGEVVLDRYFGQSGFSAVRERIRHLSAGDLDAQVTMVEQALRETVSTRFVSPFPVTDAVATADGRAKAFESAACWVADELLQRAHPHEGGLSWPGTGADITRAGLRPFHLHDGVLGPAVLFAAMAATRGEPRYREAALSAVRPLALRLIAAEAGTSSPIGGTAGVGGLVYGLTLVGALAGDDASIAMARAAARLVTPSRVDADTTLDVVEGAAGAILGLLALHDVVGDPVLVETAVACGDHLLATETGDGGGVWHTVGGACYLGFAHGVAGIAASLARLATAGGYGRHREAAIRAYARLLATHLPARGNWPLVVPSTSQGREGFAMTAWCHGAPGIVLGFLMAPEALRDARWAECVEGGLRATASAATHKAEHVCCGNLGRAETLFTASRVMYSSAAREASLRIAERVAARARSLGHVRLSAVPYAYRAFDPGFMQGLAGVGYQWARLSAPSAVPSVLAFQMRRSASDDRR